jgi:hypothetical protein
VEDPKARPGLVLLVAVEIAAVVALHRLGGVDGFAIPRHDFGRWLQQTPSEDVLLAGLRLAALLAAWWLLVTTLLYVAARVARLHRASQALGWATLPMVRRWADRAMAVSIVAAGALGATRPAAADPPPATTAPAAVVVDLDHRNRATLPELPPATARTGHSADPRPTTIGRPTETVPPPSLPSAPPTPPAPPVVPVAPSAPATNDATHTVAPGEHLWSIAATTVAVRTGRAIDDLSPGDIAPFWASLVERNRARVRSGNSSLVYPGEVLELPT